jgi:hypothetical protein
MSALWSVGERAAGPALFKRRRVPPRPRPACQLLQLTCHTKTALLL